MVTGGLGGLMLGLGLPPAPFPPLALLGVGGFALLVARSRSTRDAALGGMAFAFVASLVALHWVPAAAEPYLGVPGAVVAGGSVWLLHAAAGGLAAALAVVLAGHLPLALRTGAAWGVLEWLPGALPVVGIPWFGMAASLTGWPSLLPAVAVAGGAAFGVVVAAAWGAALAWRRERVPAIVTAAAVLALPMGALLLPGPVGQVASGPPAGMEAPSGLGMRSPASVSAVAAFEWQRTRAETSDPQALRAGVEAMLEAPLPVPAVGGAPVLALWPEAPLPTLVGDDPLALRYLQRVQASGEPRLPGAGEVDPDGAAPPPGAVAGIHAVVGGRRYNTMVRTGTREEAPEGVHRKRHLVPGVERTVLSAPGREGRGLAPGAGALPFDAGGRRVGGLICFEILYPVEVARLRRRGAEVLLQSTSDAMLQPGGPLPVVADAARRQHEAVVRLRAAEFRLPVVRAALGGRAMSFDARGRTVDALDTLEVEGGRWLTFPLSTTPSPPPSAWVAPLTGPLMLGLLLVPLVFLWRREQVLGTGR